MPGSTRWRGWYQPQAADATGAWRGGGNRSLVTRVDGPPGPCCGLGRRVYTYTWSGWQPANPTHWGNMADISQFLDKAHEQKEFSEFAELPIDALRG